MGIVFATADEAEEAFYAAFARADLEAIMQVWAQDETIHCTHPLSPCIEGRAAIRESWAAIFAEPLELEIRLSTMRRVQDAALSIHMLQENLSLTGAHQAVTPMAATNIYRLTPAGWRMISHHASPVEQPESIEAPAPQAPSTVH